jgi:hypothetical protein
MGLFLDSVSKLNEAAGDRKPFTEKEVDKAIDQIIDLIFENDGLSEDLAYFFTEMAQKHGFDDETEVDKHGNVASQAFNDVLMKSILEALKPEEIRRITKQLNSINPYTK